MTPASKWKTCRLDEIAQIQGGGTPSRLEASYFGGTIPWVTPTDLPAIGQVTELNDSKESITDAGLANSSAKLIAPGSVLFSSRASIGKIAIVNKPCATNQGFANFTPHDDIVDKWFLAYLLCRYTAEIKDLAGKTTFLEVPRSKFKAFKVAIPHIAEQRRIVTRIKECLERVEEIEVLRAEALVEAKYLAPSLYAAIEDGEKWPRMAVGDVITTSRNGRSIRQDNENANGFVLSLSAVHDISLDINQRKPIPLPDSTENHYSIKVGDVFVSRSNTRELVGLASVATENPQGRVIFPDLLIKLESKKDVVIPRFLAYALRTPESRRQIKDRAVGTSQSMVKISGQRLKEVEIPIPPLNVQRELIEKFDELHDLSVNLIGDLKSLNSSALRQSILRKAFDGEL